jgi:hypothetical protein
MKEDILSIRKMKHKPENKRRPFQMNETRIGMKRKWLDELKMEGTIDETD